MIEFDKDLIQMLQQQIVNRGINDPRILEAFQRVPRHLFVPDDCKADSYKDQPVMLPEESATISQPYMVAYMTEALRCQPSDRILEIGTGSGFQTAVLAHLCKEVYSIERHYTLGINAERTLNALSVFNVHIKTGDCLDEWKDKGPFDKIIVTAATKFIPTVLLDQLKDGGTLIIPIGEPQLQTLTRVMKSESKGNYNEQLIQCVFVPLISQSVDLTNPPKP